MPPSDILFAERSEAAYDMVDEIVDVGSAADGLFFRVQWDGLPEKQDWNWNPVQKLYDDVPDIVESFLARCRKKKLVELVRRLLNL